MDLLSQMFFRLRKPSKREKNGLWKLSPDEGNTESHATIDIIAIHGLGGDAFGTWTDEDGKLWLRDFLPARLTNARIFTYGYDSAVAFSKSSAEIDDFARDLLQRVKLARSSEEHRGSPLYFICHSLGGLVLKQALNLDNENKDANGGGDAQLLAWLRGVVFMGTPHAGSDVAFWGALAGRLLHTASLGTSTNRGLLKLLRKDSTFLGALSLRFAMENPQIRILSFYELEKFPFLNCRIVEKSSAQLHLPNETALPIQADHRAMCRFGDSTSQKYRAVEDAISELLRLTQTVGGLVDSGIIDGEYS
ncbi:Alpha/Beta hydrolase protein [Ilyonectria sp. MPI-CAGE-AT-0026]|nr:Alpha/Beta hydrolase protein [Ilyonectria sp. MPI-CAGE-AT-0026]